jgi:hypothetical protein
MNASSIRAFFSGHPRRQRALARENAMLSLTGQAGKALLATEITENTGGERKKNQVINCF